jgi:hypothetical protein
VIANEDGERQLATRIAFNVRGSAWNSGCSVC